MIDMNKKEIISKLKKYNFDENNYVVISGAAMVLLGIKESTGDIDISVTEEFNDYLLNNYNCIFERINEYNTAAYFIDDIINFSTTYYTENKIFIDNIPVQAPEEILSLKKNLNREKDKIDVERIESYMRDNT